MKFERQDISKNGYFHISGDHSIDYSRYNVIRKIMARLESSGELMHIIVKLMGKQYKTAHKPAMLYGTKWLETKEERVQCG